MILVVCCSVLDDFAFVLLGLHLGLSLVELLEHDVVGLVAELCAEVQVVAILAAVEDELVGVAADLVAELANHCLGSRWLAAVAMPRALLSSLDVELALELECLSVTWRPPLCRPVLVVSLWKHQSQLGDVCELKLLINDDAHQVMISALTECIFWQNRLAGSINLSLLQSR